jgi:hypothetical protein
VNYTIKDQLSATLPSAIPLNEYYSTGIVSDYPGTNWRRNDPNGYTTSDSMFADRIQGEAATRTPTATCDGNSTKVQHWGQEFCIGSLTPGAGALVESHTLQKYIGYADHI